MGGIGGIGGMSGLTLAFILSQEQINLYKHIMARHGKFLLLLFFQISKLSAHLQIE